MKYVINCTIKIHYEHSQLGPGMFVTVGQNAKYINQDSRKHLNTLFLYVINTQHYHRLDESKTCVQVKVC